MAGAVYLAIAIFFHPVGDYYTESDFYGGYADGARLIQRGIVDPARYVVVGPGFEVALAAVGFVVRDLFTAAKLISVASAIGTLVCWALLLRRRAGTSLALWTVALLAVNPVFVRYAYSATTDMLSTFLISACVCGWTMGRRGAAAAGAFAAAATLTRFNAIVLVPAGAVALTVLGRWTARRARIEVLLFIATFACLVAPWVVHGALSGHVPGEVLFRRFGFYSSDVGSRNIQDAVVGAETPDEPASLGEVWSKDPGGFARRILSNTVGHLRRNLVDLIGWPLIPLVLIGIAVAIAIRDGTWRALAPGSIAGLGMFISLLPVFYSDRYSLPLAPVYLSWAGAALARPHWSRFVGTRAVNAVGILLLAATAIRSVAAQRRVFAEAPVESLAAGRALADVATHRDRVLSRKGHVGYYAGVETVEFPRFRTLPELAHYAGRRGARFLYFSWFEGQLRPELAFLLDPTAGVPGLEPIFTSSGQPAVLYRLLPSFGLEPVWWGDEFQRKVHNARVMVRLVPDSLSWGPRTVLAVDALARDRPIEALALASAAIRVNPLDTLAWVVQGEAFRSQGRHREALSSYRRALVLDPHDRVAAIGQSRSQAALGDSVPH